MNRDEFLILVCDGETLDTDTVMTEYDRLTSELTSLKVISDSLQQTINELGVERDAMRKALQRIQKLTLDRTMPPYTTMAEIYSIARDGMEAG